MAPLALALAVPLALASAGGLDVPAPAPPPAPDVLLAARAPRLELELGAPHEPRPFRRGELVGASLGAFAGDAVVLGAGYLSLQLVAAGTIAPTATNFRRMIYGFAAAALVVPPLTAVLFARLAGGPHARGGFWKALLLATTGQAVALAAGYLASPHLWVVLPVQALAVSLGTSSGLHWGPYPRAHEGRVAADAARGRGDPPAAASVALAAVPVCADR